MKKTVLTLALLGGLSFPNGAFAQDMTKEDVQGIIKEFIKDNPEVILDAVESYGREQQAADIRARQEAVKEHLGWLENNDMLPIAGNPDGDVTMVEFFDYNCGYCKKALDDVMTLIEEDKNLKVVFVEMPILGPSSQLAARWAMAAKEQDA
jgi:protein-disulfide isomerase